MQHVGLTAWRKKSTVLLAAALLALIVFGLHYTQVKDENKMHQDQDIKGPVEVVAALLQSASVKFVDSEQSRKASTTDIAHNEIVSQVNQNHEEALRTNRETMETEQQLGIPFVNLDLKNPYIPKKRIVHFDFKGAPPTVNYLKKVFSLIRTLGATGILLGNV